ncbi:hypothetical protein HF086_018403 [Spodoptera exigua]|uniref:Uncharacterized protein n=1 Tax=Spodoptera exigua TaxID=7107 RepID=A0A922MPI3_SPOEX|nr:hypothetical protein HF086_018403 [Spodoptera exigua]
MTIDKLDDAIALSILIFMWQSKDLLWQTIVTKQCEKFYLALQRLQDTCSLILMSSCSGGKKKIKNVVSKESPSLEYQATHKTFFIFTRIIISLFYLTDTERKLYKNVLRLHRASFSKIRVCSLFYVDAALQLSLMSQLTNYIIVLLQFAIL